LNLAYETNIKKIRFDHFKLALLLLILQVLIMREFSITNILIYIFVLLILIISDVRKSVFKLDIINESVINIRYSLRKQTSINLYECESISYHKDYGKELRFHLRSGKICIISLKYLSEPLRLLEDIEESSQKSIKRVQQHWFLRILDWF